jgi:adenine-specific DNA-methyltransferase
MDYYTDQIITYMGNKRKMLSPIESILHTIKQQLGKDQLTIGDGFSGSGITSRLFKNHASLLYTNDLAGYSKTLNQCYLANPDNHTIEKIHQYIDQANFFAANDVNEPKFIQLHWSPKTDVISEGERAYFTHENGRRIDSYRQFITTLPDEYQAFLLAPLLFQASKHNNCSGNFAAYYKKNNVGHFGGKNETDVKRITQPIVLPYPIFSSNHCPVIVSQKDANQWAMDSSRELEFDLVYYDPPYNKHPYHIYYFLLELIHHWDTTIEIPDTFRGQPKNWTSSFYNSYRAKEVFEDLIKHTRSKYILVSYNNQGIITDTDMKALLGNYGHVTEHFVEHKTYNRMKGIAEYKKTTTDTTNIKECLYLLQKLKV